MLVCRSRPRRFAVLSFFSTSPASTSNTTAESTSQAVDKPQDSIFTAPESPWDHVFSDVEPVEPPSSSPAQRIRARLQARNDPSARPASRPNVKGHHPSPQQNNLLQRASGARRQRASITAREMSVFDEMFDMIFNAVSARDGTTSDSGSRLSSRRTPGSGSFASSAVSSPSSLLGQTPGIGRTGAGAPLNDLFRTLRRQTSRTRWTTAIDEELDRKKETMELFDTDYELLRWVTTELFEESQPRWDEEAKKAMTTGAAGATSAAAGTSRDGKGEESGATATAATSGSLKGGSSRHSIYPHLIAHAMRIFRTTYSNPSLSLAIFNHAANVSIPSYVFGCTAPAYNEMIEAKWEGWGDLEGVCNALEEMRANGIKIDGRTRVLAETVRREVGEARPVAFGELALETDEEDDQSSRPDTKDVNPLARRVWERLEEQEVMGLVHRIERLALRDRSRKSTRSSPHEESWKSAVLQPAGDDGWSFDGWEARDAKEQKRKGKPLSQDKADSRTLDDWPTLGVSEEEMAFR